MPVELYLLLKLKVLHFSCLEKLELVLKLLFSLIFQMLHLLPLSTQMVLFSFLLNPLFSLHNLQKRLCVSDKNLLGQDSFWLLLLSLVWGNS